MDKEQLVSKKSLYYVIIEAYPELTPDDFSNGTIQLQNDSDGLGEYIKTWNYEQPIPEGLTLGKPSA